MLKWRQQKLSEDYYKAKIDHNHLNFHILQEVVKQERTALRASINSFKNQAPLLINQLSIHVKVIRSRKKTEK